jgi:hypothetical protein
MDSPESLRGIPMTRRCWLRRGMHHKVAFWNAGLVGRVFAPRARRPPGGIVVPDIIDRLHEVAPLGALGPQAPLEPLGQLCLVGAGRRGGGSTRPSAARQPSYPSTICGMSTSRDCHRRNGLNRR